MAWNNSVGSESEVPEHCGRCGDCEMEWVKCWDCGGEGEIDRYDDDPLWYVGKMRFWRCDICEGEGSFKVCMGRCDDNAAHHWEMREV